MDKLYIYRPLAYERVYLPLYKVADTPFHIQGDDICMNAERKPHYVVLDMYIILNLLSSYMDLVEQKFITWNEVNVII